MAAHVTPDNEDWELLTSGHGPTHLSRIRRGLLDFLWHHPTILVSLTLGTCGTFACFGFTLRLSKQAFDCPNWALYCSVPSPVHYFALHLNQVQGFVSAIYAIFMSMVTYAAYQIAETTLWPALTRRTFTLRNIDRYLAVCRGAYIASLAALWHARGTYHTCVILTIALTALLLEVNSVIVGHALTLTKVPSTFLSNHITSYEGTGFGFNQANPPGMLPGAIGNAYPVYNAWANGVSDEPMPEQRDYIVDRSNISDIGNFSVHAIEAHKHINCSGMPINITEEYINLGFESYFVVATHVESDNIFSNNSESSVALRLQGQLTLWADQWTKLDNQSAVTRLVFAAVNGSIEGGYSNPATDQMKNYGYNGISSLACDVSVSLNDSVLCVPQEPCGESDGNWPNATLSSIINFNGDDAFQNAIWLVAVLGTFGVPVFGYQPMFSPGPFVDNTSLAFPIAWTSIALAGVPYHWTQANLTNFIKVGSGALALVYTRSNASTAARPSSTRKGWIRGGHTSC